MKKRLFIALCCVLMTAAGARAQDKKISELTALTAATADDVLPIVDSPGGSPVTKKITAEALLKLAPAIYAFAFSDETTALTTGTAKLTFRMPFAMTVTGVRCSLTTASSSGTPTIDINEAGTTILSTKVTLDVSEKTSTTAAAAAVISDSSLADDAEVTVDVDVAGTGAAGGKCVLIGVRP